MLILANYSYHRPNTIEEAWRLLEEEGSMIIAGGSDVMPQLKTAVIKPNALVDLAGIEDLRRVEEQEDGIHIGSMAVLSHLAKNPLILEKVPAVSQAARNVASPQIRSRATIGGNLLQARRCFYYNQTKEWRKGIPLCYKVGGDRCIQIPNSPVCRAIYYSDLAPVLLACEALAVVRTADGEKRISCRELVEAHCRDQDEKMLVREFVIPKEKLEDSWGGFRKYSLRGSIDFPMINFACWYQPGQVRLTAGAIATKVLELEDTERYLTEQGKGFQVSEAVELAQGEMKKKSQIIREAGISVTVKRETFLFVEELLEQLKKAIQ